MQDELKQLMDRIKGGAVVVTANKRLSRHICLEYDSSMKYAGHSSWKSPEILPFSAWTSSLWNGSWPDKPLLSAVRAGILWERVVAGDRLPGGVLSGRGIAGISYDAYALMKEYRITLPDDIYLTEEARALKRWAATYEAEVERLGFEEPSALCDRLIGLIEEGKAEVPGRIILAGFDDVTPRMSSMIMAVERRGSGVDFWPHHNSSPAGRVTIKAYSDETEEVVQAARWAREVFRPGMRIGFIVPELERYRDVIRREFTAELNPGGILPWGEKKDVFNISLGEPLSEEPIVGTALKILSTGLEPLNVEEAGFLLLSPYIAAGEDEYLALSRLDAVMRRERFVIRLSDIPGMIERRRLGLAGFRERLDRWLKALKENYRNDLPSGWANSFGRLLREVGFPSPGLALSSTEFQALEAWNDLLKDLASLDDILGRIGRDEAVTRLRRLAEERIHQPETKESPLQVMGLMESSGLFFDHIRIIGAHSDALPPQPSPNPFIPLFVQKRLDLPHSSHERELRFAKSVVNRVLGSAPFLYVSYPQVVEDKAVSLSPLFEHMGLPDTELIKGSGRLTDAVHLLSSGEDIPPDGDIPITGEELKSISGGTSIIKNQSACPFRAFAVHRLNAKGVAVPEFGLSASRRGAIVHAALKAFWNAMGGLEYLKETAGRGGLGPFIREAVKGALGASTVEPFSDRYLEIERECMEAVLEEWMGVELGRNEFTVEKTEYSADMDIEGIKMKVCIDRIDGVNGRKVIIDYKTGECSRYDWLTERPREPQLLVYNLIDGFDAISYAKVRLGECGFAGISREGDILPGVPPFEDDLPLRGKAPETWEGLMESWKGVVRRLAREFLEGNAAVDPSGSACEHCELMGLCRFFEAEAKGDEDE